MFATSIHHAGIVVSDLERSILFYRDILGWKILFSDTLGIPNLGEVMGVKDVKGRTVVLQKEVGNVQGMIELIEISNPRPSSSKEGRDFGTHGLRLLSFRVNDIEKVYSDLIKKGVKFLSPPKELHFEKYSIKSCIFLDPDQVRLEIIEFLDVQH